LKNPGRIEEGIDKLGRPFIKYIAETATVLLNTAGKIITAYGLPK
jgi:hypothetical protein